MGLEEILDNIDRATEEEVQHILSDANGEAKRILAEAEASAREQEQAGVEKAESDARQLVARETSKASIAAKMAYYGEVNKRVGAAFEGVSGSLQAYTKTQGYKKLLNALAARAAKELGDGCTILVQQGDVQAVKAGKAKVSIGVAKERFAGGLKAASADGKQEVDYTLEALLERLRDRIAMKLLERIKGKGS